MDPDALRAYALRDWDAQAASKRAYWADRYRREGPCATMQASQTLLAEMRQLRPGYPSAEDRRVDLDSHLRLRSLLDRAAHAIAGR